MTVLRGNDLSDMNSMAQPGNVKPTVQKLKLKGKKIALPLSPYSFTVLRVKMS